MEKPEKVFSQRLSFYGKALVIYIFILVVFIILRGAIIDGKLTLVLYDPVILLMLIVISITSIVLLIATIRKRQIIISEDYLIFKNRFISRKYDIGEIKYIKIMRSPSKVVNNSASIIRIKLKNKKKVFIIRTAAYIEDAELLKTFANLRNKIKNH